MHVTKGLFIKPRWIDLILSGKKTWEMRSTATAHRGWFGLVGSGTGKIWGLANLVGVGPAQSITDMLAHVSEHCISETMIRSGDVAKWPIPWIIGDVSRISPVASRAKGQLWVNLEPQAVEKIAAQFSGLSSKCSDTRAVSIALQIRPEVPPIQPQRSTKRSATDAASGMWGEVSITEGNINNDHFYLRSFIDRFPPDLIGGKDRSTLVLALIQADGMPSTRTDICQRHRIFRDRSWTRAFFESNAAKPGDRVRVEEVAPYHYSISLRKKGAN